MQINTGETMKDRLTKEQSARLIELGVPREMASKIYWKEVTDYRGRPFEFDYDFREGITDKPFALQRVGLTSFDTQDIFTLTDLLEILPKEITTKDGDVCLEIQMLNDTCSVSYEYIAHGGCKEYFEAEELIDALYELLCWVIENNYLKTEQL